MKILITEEQSKRLINKVVSSVENVLEIKKDTKLINREKPIDKK